MEGLAAAYRDRFSLKSAGAGRWSGTDGRRGRANGAWLERVCGRLRRPQSRRRVAVRAEVPWAAKVPGGLEPSWRDWRRDSRIAELRPHAGTNASLTAFWVGGRGSRLTSRRSGSCASATGWAYNQPKADRFFYRHNQCARKVIDKTMIRNDLLIFASVSEHLGKDRPKLRL